jgi:site-specific recombinase XerD
MRNGGLSARAATTAPGQLSGTITAWAVTQDVREVEQITAPLVHRFLANLSQGLSDYTRRGYAQSVKAFLNWCAREDLIGDKIPRRITMPRVTEKVIQTFTPTR